MAYIVVGEDHRTGCTMMKCTKHDKVFARVEPGCPECEEEQAEAYDKWRKNVEYHGGDPDNMDYY